MRRSPRNQTIAVLIRENRSWFRGLTRSLRHLPQIFDRVTELFDLAYQPLVVLGGDTRTASHDPNIVTGVAGNNGLLIIPVNVGNDVLSTNWPDELHSPNGILAIRICASHRVECSRRRVKAAVPISESSLYFTIGRQYVALNCIVSIPFDEGWNVCDDVPVSHEARQVDSVDRLDRLTMWRASRQDHGRCKGRKNSSFHSHRSCPPDLAKR